MKKDRVKFINLKMLPFKLDHNRQISIIAENPDFVYLSERLAKIGRLYPTYLKEVADEDVLNEDQIENEIEEIIDNNDIHETQEELVEVTEDIENETVVEPEINQLEDVQEEKSIMDKKATKKVKKVNKKKVKK